MKNRVVWAAAGGAAVLIVGLALTAMYGIKRWKEGARGAAAAASAGSARGPIRVVALPLPEAPTEVPFVGQKGVGADGYPLECVSMVGFQALLRHRKFEDLTRFVEGLQREFEAEPKKEYWISDALTAFASEDPAFGPLLDAWIAEHPRSFAGYAARGKYHGALARKERGGDTAAKTSVAQFAGMRRELGLAERDLEQAIALEPDAIAAYLQLISDGNLVNKDEPAFRRAVARFPLSFRVYVAGMMAKRPRWGGSYGKMAEVAAMGERQLAANPRMKLLRGFVEYATFEDRRTDKDYKGALEAAEKAVKYGEHWDFFEARADARFRLDDVKGALEDYDRTLALQPEDGEALRGRASALWKLKRFEEAADTYLSSLAIDPSDDSKKLHEYADLFVFVGNKHFNAGRSREALAAYDKALLLEPGNADATRWRAELLRRGDPTADPDEATRLNVAAAQSDTFEAYLALDDALAKRGRMSEVIEAWNGFLQRHPNEGRAYLERGGAFTRVKKMDEARRDAEKACELGVAKGCEYAKRLRKP